MQDTDAIELLTFAVADRHRAGLFAVKANFFLGYLGSASTQLSSSGRRHHATAMTVKQSKIVRFTTRLVPGGMRTQKDGFRPGGAAIF